MLTVTAYASLGSIIGCFHYPLLTFYYLINYESPYTPFIKKENLRADVSESIKSVSLTLLG